MKYLPVSYRRSYVVRHIRDTHRDKPMKIIDLMETGEINNNPDDSEVLNESDDMTMDISRSEDMHDSSNQGTFIKLSLSNDNLVYRTLYKNLLSTVL